MRFHILLFFCLLQCKLVLGQDLHYTIIDKSKGLPSNDVYDIFQDKKGFIWLAHEDGLSRYDGYEFRTYASPKQTSRAGTNIQEDSYGRVWYQNFDGMVYYVERDSLRTLEQNTPIGYLRFGIGKKNLFVIQKQGLDIFDLKTLKLQKTIPLEFNPAEISATFFINNRFYISHILYLYELDENFNWKTYSHYSSKATNFPGLADASSGNILLATQANNMQECYELGEKSYMPKFKTGNIGFIQNLSCTDDLCWFCTSLGVYLYYKDGQPLHHNTPFIPDKSITVVKKDREGNFWFGTRGSGILFVSNLNSKVLFENIQSFRMLLQDNTLYIGTKNDELYKTDLNNYSFQQIYKGTDNHPVNIHYYDSLTRQLIVSSRKFMFMSESGKVNKSWTAATKSTVKINPKYYAFAASGTFGLLKNESVSTENEWDDLYKKHYISENNFVVSGFVLGTRGRSVTYNEKTKQLYFSSSHGLWTATPDSVYEIKQGDSSLFLQKIVLLGNYLYSYNTNGALVRIDQSNNQVETIPFTNDWKRVKNLKKSEEYLLVQTDNELLYWDSRETKLEFKKIHLPDMDINDFLIWKNQLILATKKGILIQDFEQSAQVGSPIFHINSIKVNNIAQENFKKLYLPYYQNNIEIQYSILSFKTGSKFPLYYQINENEWELAPSETRLLKLVALSPGQYHIRFKLGAPNDKNYPIQNIFIHISLPWWQEWWFLGLCAFVIGAVSYAYYRQQTNMLIQQNKLLSEKIVLEQNLSQSTLKAIKSQMNPHFFYNALNTIQSFIYADDKKNASAYLSKFSKLTRLILEMSETEKITLNEEINALNLYLEIEKVRFNNDFEYHIVINQNIDKELIKIPSMLIQPYVENAIKHGLLHHHGSKKLEIRFELEKDFLKVTIEDNGIGRKRSEELNRIKKGQHQSFSTNANATRLEILTKGKSTQSSVVYIDHLDPTGTTVILSIPLN